MTERVDSPSATSGKGRDPGYVEVDASGFPVGKAEDLDAADKRKVRDGAILTADERTKVNEARPEPTAAERSGEDDVPVKFARPGETEPDDATNDEADAAETEASAVSETSPSEEDVAVADEPAPTSPRSRAKK